MTPIIAGTICGICVGTAWLVALIVVIVKRTKRKKRKRAGEDVDDAGDESNEAASLLAYTHDAVSYMA